MAITTHEAGVNRTELLDRLVSLCKDVIPTEQYSKDDARRAIDDARFVVQMAELTIK
jgi:hypothetical protein